MTLIRLIGILLGVLLIILGTWRYSKGKSRRLDLLLSWLMGIAMILLGGYPSAFSPVFDTVNFRREDNRQLLGVLIASNMLLVFLYFLVSSSATSAHRQLTQLTRRIAQREFLQSIPMQSPDVVVVIPAYNEENSIGDVLRDLPQEILGLSVQPLVVVDGASDRTEEEARKYGATIAHAINRGQGAALVTGYEMAARWGAKMIVAMDADGQAVPSELSSLLEPIINDEADLVHGSRFLGSYENYSALRPLAVRAISLIISLLLRTRITDFATPFKAFRGDKVTMLKLEEVQFQASEVLIEAFRHRLRFKEVPITMRGRKAGESKKPKLALYGLGIARTIVRSWLR